MSLDDTSKENVELMEKIRQQRINTRKLCLTKFDIEAKNDIHSSTVTYTDNTTYTDNMLRELKANEPTSNNRQFRMNIIMYEIGDLARALVYSDRFRDDEKQFRIRMADGKSAIADVLTQLFLLCETTGWDFHEMRKLGAEHLKERHEDFRRQGWCEIGGK